MTYRCINGEPINKISMSNGTSKLRRICRSCGGKFIPTGKFSKKCEKCKDEIFRETYKKQRIRRVTKVV